MYLYKEINKHKISELFLVGILKVTDEKSRIRSLIRIRIRGSESAEPLCHGSGTLPMEGGKKIVKRQF
jgi:hypothetical protein